MASTVNAMDYPAAQPEMPYKQYSARTLLAYPPWTAFFSSIVIIIGMGFWVHNGSKGAKEAKEALDSLQITYEHSGLAYRAIIGTGVVLLFMLVLLVVLSCFRSVLEVQRDTEGHMPRAKMYLTLNAAGSVLFWFLVCWVVMVFAICSVTAAASFSLERSLEATVQSVDARVAYGKSLYNATQQIILFFDSLPRTVKRDPGTKAALTELKRQNSINGGLACPTYCLDLSRLSFIKGTTCICDPLRMAAAQQHAKSAVRYFGPALFGLAVIYVGCSWLLANLVSQYVHTSLDRKLLREAGAYAHNIAATHDFSGTAAAYDKGLPY